MIVDNSKTEFSISDLNGGKIKTFKASNNKTLNFKTSRLFQEYANSNSPKKTETLREFFNRISDLNLGISSYPFKNNNLVTFGGVSEHIKKIDTDSELAFIFSQFGLIGALIYVAFYNQDITNYDFSRDFIYFYTYLDSDYNLLQNQISYTPMDQVRSFFNSNPKAAFPTLICFKNSNYLSYYNFDNKQYITLFYSK